MTEKKAEVVETTEAKETETLNLKSLVGLTETEAVSTIKASGMKVRVRKRDGQAFIGTCDYRTDRVNLSIENGKVTKASIG